FSRNQGRRAQFARSRKEPQEHREPGALKPAPPPNAGERVPARGCTAFCDSNCQVIHRPGHGREPQCNAPEPQPNQKYSEFARKKPAVRRVLGSLHRIAYGKADYSAVVSSLPVSSTSLATSISLRRLLRASRWRRV